MGIFEIYSNNLIYKTCVSGEDYSYLYRFTWFVNTHSNRINYLTFYRTIRLEGKNHNIEMHREIGIRMGLDPNYQFDHKDRNTLNNRRENLREATNSQNNSNKDRRIDNKTGYIGVQKRKDTTKYRVRLQANKTPIHIGYYEDIIEAALAYDRAALRYLGEFASLNFPQKQLNFPVGP